jgi:hypothetical protein
VLSHHTIRSPANGTIRDSRRALALPVIAHRALVIILAIESVA